MPVIQNAKKALRRDRRRTLYNRVTKLKLQTAVKTFLETINQQNLSQTQRHLDRAVKKNLLHKNKAARLKSQLSKKLKLTSTSPSKSNPTTPKKKSQIKTTKS